MANREVKLVMFVPDHLPAVTASNSVPVIRIVDHQIVVDAPTFRWVNLLIEHRLDRRCGSALRANRLAAFDCGLVINIPIGLQGDAIKLVCRSNADDITSHIIGDIFRIAEQGIAIATAALAIKIDDVAGIDHGSRKALGDRGSTGKIAEALGHLACGKTLMNSRAVDNDIMAEVARVAPGHPRIL
jgi:hypothetical protein